METVETVQSDLLSVFNMLTGKQVLLLPDAPRFTVLAATDEYLAANFIRRKELCRRGLFDQVSQAASVSHLDAFRKTSALMLQAVENRQTESVNIDFDIENPASGEREFRSWNATVKPVIEGGAVRYLILNIADSQSATAIEEIRPEKQSKANSQSEVQVRAIIESAPFPIGVYVGREMRIQFANKSMIDVWGKGPDVIGKTYPEVLPELGNQEIYEQLDFVYRSGTAFHRRNQRVDIMVNGKLQAFYFNYSFTPLFDAEGKVYGVMNTAAEITDLVTAKQQAEQSELNFRSMIVQAPVAMCILLGPRHIVDVANEKMVQIWGKPREAVSAKPIFEALPDARDQGLEQLLDDVFYNGATHRFDERAVELLRNGKKETTYLNFVYQPYRDGQGNIAGVLAVCLDLTEQVMARREIEQSTEELQMAIAVAELGTFRMDLLNSRISFSKRVMDWLGMNRQTLSIREVMEYVHPRDRSTLRDALAQSYVSEESSRHDITYRISDKKNVVTRYLHSFGKTYFGSDKKPAFIVGMIQDVTSQVLYQKQLKQSEEQLQARVEERTRQLENQKNLLNNILLNSSNGISVMKMLRNTEGEIIDAIAIIANDAALRYTGMPQEIFLGKTSTEIDPSLLQSDYWKSCLNTLATGEPSVMQYFLSASGRWLEFTVSRMDDDHLIQIFTDITSIKESQLRLEKLVEDLRRSNANLGEFAYAASHDMKEPIRKIRFFADRLKEELEDTLSGRQKTLFQKLEHASERMGLLIDDLLTYSQTTRGIAEEEKVDLDAALHHVLVDLELLITEKAAVINADALPVVSGNSRQLQQLLQNLVNNALKYSKTGVTPEINIGCKKVQGHEVREDLTMEQANRKFYCISVKDNGIGFDQNDAERIFNVFTRLHGNAEYRGTGVGLSIVRKVVENHNGHIWAESHPGMGATFFMLLPAE